MLCKNSAMTKCHTLAFQPLCTSYPLANQFS